MLGILCVCVVVIHLSIIRHKHDTSMNGCFTRSQQSSKRKDHWEKYTLCRVNVLVMCKDPECHFDTPLIINWLDWNCQNALLTFCNSHTPLILNMDKTHVWQALEKHGFCWHPTSGELVTTYFILFFYTTKVIGSQWFFKQYMKSTHCQSSQSCVTRQITKKETTRAEIHLSV